MIRRNTTNMHTEGMGRVNPNILSPSSSSSRRNNGINQRLDQQPSQNTTGSKVPISTYKYNTTTAILLLPPLLLIYHQAATATLGAIIYVILSLYLFDLSGMSHTSREFLLLFLWIGFFFVSVSLWVDRLGGGVGHGNVYVAVGMGDLIMETMLIFCLTCWAQLQIQWFIKIPGSGKGIERILHATLPLTSTSVFLRKSLTYFDGVEVGGGDWMALAFPHLFAFWLAFGIASLGNSVSSFEEATEEYEEAVADGLIPPIPEDQMGEEQRQTEDDDGFRRTIGERSITESDGCALSFILLVLPTLMHLVIFRRRLSAFHGADLVDLLLVLLVTFGLHFIIEYWGFVWWRLELHTLVRLPSSSLANYSNPRRRNRGHGRSIDKRLVLLFILTLSSFLYRYLIPFATSRQYHQTANALQSHLNTIITWSTLGLLFLYASYRLNGNPNKVLENYKWRMVVGMAFVGFILLVVSIKDLIIQLSHQFTYIQKPVWIIPNALSISLKSFSYLLVAMGILSLVSTALIVLVRDGSLEGRIRRYVTIDILLVFYAGMSIMVEGTLIYGSLNHVVGGGHDGWGGVGGGEIFGRDGYSGGYEALYPSYWALMTGVGMTFLSWWLVARKKVVGALAYFVSVSLCVGKTIAIVTVDCDVAVGVMHAQFLTTASLASMLVFVIGFPYAYIAYHRQLSGNHGGGGESRITIQSIGGKILEAYFAFLILVLPFSIPTVLKPLMDLILLSPEKRGPNYYEYDTPLRSVEMLGYSLSLWGFSVVSILSICRKGCHLDSTLELWRNLSSLSFLLGIILLLTTPEAPLFHQNEDITIGDISSMFTAISSRGLPLQSNTGCEGGWGVVCATLALFLAAIGPLNVHSKTASEHDRRFFTRLLVFSLLFGGGVSWCLTLQLLSGGGGATTMMGICKVWIPSLVIACLGTTASVLGYRIDANDISTSLVQIYKIIIGGVGGLIVIIATLDSIVGPVVVSGWWSSNFLTTQLSTSFFFSLSLSGALRSRCGTQKTARTRAFGNLSCVISWFFALVLIYRRYGLASIGVISNWSMVMGVPASVFFTIVIYPILLLLEGEEASSSQPKKRRRRRIVQATKPVFGITLPPLPTLRQLSGHYLALGATTSIFVIVSLYAVLLRGLFQSHVSHEDVYHHFYGSTSDGDHDHQSDDHIAKMVQQDHAHSHAVVQAAKLAGCSFWTSTSCYGPILHFVGILAIIPSLYMVVSSLGGWWSWPLSGGGLGRRASYSLMSRWVPLHIFPFILCHGIPSLRVASVFGFLVGVGYCHDSLDVEWNRQMNL